MTTQVTDIDQTALHALIGRVEHAIKHDLALSTEDLHHLLAAIQTLLEVHHRAEQDELTLYKLKKLLGIVRQSERHERQDKSARRRQTLSSKQRAAKKVATLRQIPEVKHHLLTADKKGQPCPFCLKGKRYKYHPGQLLRITGPSPLSSTKHVTERMRCHTCSDIVTASLPDEVLLDGHANQK